MRVAFAGTPEFAAVALRALAQAGHELVLVLTQPDRPAGRGMKLQASPVKTLAASLGLPVVQPRSLRLEGRYPEDAARAREALLAARPEVLVVAAYGLILPAWSLSLPRHGCVNIHASLLPRWRGAAPIQRAIEAGDEHTGITLMQMDEGLDTGDILRAQALPIDAQETCGSLHDRLADLGAQMIVQALPEISAGTLPPRPQPQDGVTVAAKISRADSAIDWRESAAVLERRLRALDPHPGCAFECGGQLLKLWRAAAWLDWPDRLEPDRSGRPGSTKGLEPGTVVSIGPQRLAVVCGQGLLEPLQVQRPGGRRIDFAAFVRADPHTWQPGLRLGGPPQVPVGTGR